MIDSCLCAGGGRRANIAESGRACIGAEQNEKEEERGDA